MELDSGLFGKKPKAVEIYNNGIKILFKNREEIYYYNEITAIKSMSHFYPNTINYHYDIYQGNKQVAALSIPYVNRDAGTQLLLAHKNALLGKDFPDKLSETTYILDDSLDWEKNKLVYARGKAVGEYSVEEIDDFKEEGGCFFFTLKNSKDTIALYLHDAPNCLMSIDICKAIAKMK